MTLSKHTMMAALVAAAATFAASDAMAVQPSAGIYTGESQYTSSVASGGATCPTVGSKSTQAYFYYPGPNAKGAVAHVGVFITNKYYMVDVAFPTTPAAGVTTWSGTANLSIPTLGVHYIYPFSTTYTFLTADTFTSVGGTTIPGNNGKGSCKVTQAGYSIRTGK